VAYTVDAASVPGSISRGASERSRSSCQTVFRDPVLEVTLLQNGTNELSQTIQCVRVVLALNIRSPTRPPNRADWQLVVRNSAPGLVERSPGGRVGTAARRTDGCRHGDLGRHQSGPDRAMQCTWRRLYCADNSMITERIEK
jgi:hypothetical protein